MSQQLFVSFFIELLPDQLQKVRELKTDTLYHEIISAGIPCSQDDIKKLAALVKSSAEKKLAGPFDVVISGWGSMGPPPIDPSLHKLD